MASNSPVEPEASPSLRVEGSLDIYSVKLLHGRLDADLEQGVPLTLDLSAVDACDAAGLQLLQALRATCERRGLPLQLRSPSKALCEAAALAGMAESLFPAKQAPTP